MQHSKESGHIINLHNYSGPLDLLLQMIRQQEMDIFKIDILQITNQYVNYLKQVPQPDLDRAGDFIRTASWLLYIKSKSLLPKEIQDEEEPDFNELKKTLSALLVNYQKFQKLGELLYSRNLLSRDCWKTPQVFQMKAPVENKIELDKEKALFQLSQSYYQKLLATKSKQEYQVALPVPSLFQRLQETASFFKIGLRLKFSQLVLVHKTPYSFLLSFLSLLELSKLGFINLFQKSLFSSIDIKVEKEITQETLKDINSNKDITI